jgi:hypothetical protein
MANSSLFKAVYRVLSWVTLAGLVVTILLVMRKSSPPDVPYDPAAAASVEQKFAAADQAKSSGRPARVLLNRTELNSYLTQNLDLSDATPGAGNGHPSGSTFAPGAGLVGTDQPALAEVQSSVKDVKVDMDGDVVKAYVVFNFHGKDLSLELDGHLGAQDGYVKFDPVAGKLGSLPLPQSTLDAAVEKLMASPENREKLKLPADISDIQIVNGQAVVSYK